MMVFLDDDISFENWAGSMFVERGCVIRDIDPPAAILNRAAAETACGCCDMFETSFCLRPLAGADLHEIVPILEFSK